jgi:copper chaperone
MTVFSVPDMTCGHCKASVTSTLSQLKDIGAINVDLTTRQVEITGTAPEAAVIAALDEIGFPAQPVAAP